MRQNVFLHRMPKFCRMLLRWTPHWNFGTICPLRWTCRWSHGFFPVWMSAPSLNTVPVCGSLVTLQTFTSSNPFSTSGPSALMACHILSTSLDFWHLGNQYLVQGRLFRSDMTQCWKIFHGKCSISPTNLFTMAPQSGTRGNRYKVNHIHAATDVQKRAFAICCVGPWNAMPDEVVSEENICSYKKKSLQMF